MRAFFYARVREARKKTGLGNFDFFGIFGNCGGGWSGLGLSGSEKFLDFWDFWVSKGMEITTYIY